MTAVTTQDVNKSSASIQVGLKAMEPGLQLEIVPSLQKSPFCDYRIGK